MSNGDDAISGVWNWYNPVKVPDTKHGKYQNSLLTDNIKKLSMSKNISSNLKYNF